MPVLDCNLSSPIHIEETNVSSIPPIIFARRIYLIEEKKLLELLQKTGLLKEFDEIIKEKGYEYTARWLSSKGFMNEEILETISKYWINNIDIRKFNDYESFLKDVNNNPTITSNNIKNLLKKALLYKYIQDRKSLFNDLISKELDIIEQDLLSADDFVSFTTKQRIYIKSFFNSVLEIFLSNIDTKISENLQNIENMNFSLSMSLKSEDLKLHRVGNLNGYNNTGFQITNIAQRECLKENTNIKINAVSNNNDHILKNLLEYADNLTKAKLNFGRNYMLRLLSGNDANFSISDINTGKQIIQDWNESSFMDRNISRKAIKRIKIIKENIENYYESIKDANMLICSNKELNELICILNMDKSNTMRLNELIYNRNIKMISNLISVCLEKDNTPCSLLGFANLDF